MSGLHLGFLQTGSDDRFEPALKLMTKALSALGVYYLMPSILECTCSQAYEMKPSDPLVVRTT